MKKSAATTDLENTTDLTPGQTKNITKKSKQHLPPPIVAASSSLRGHPDDDEDDAQNQQDDLQDSEDEQDEDDEGDAEVIPGGADQIVDSTGTSPIGTSASDDIDGCLVNAALLNRNVFQTSYAGRPCGLQGPSQKAGELGLQWLNVMKNQVKNGKGGPSDSRWAEMIQTQKLEIEEQQQQYRQFYLDREAEKTKMSRIDHRHALQQLVVEAFRWRRLPPHGAESPESADEPKKQEGQPQEDFDDRLREEASSLTSPRTMRTVTSLESMGMTLDEEEQAEGLNHGTRGLDDGLPSSSPLPPQASSPTAGAGRHQTIPPPTETTSGQGSTPSMIGSSSCCSASSTSSTMSSCNRQLWRRKFPLPSTVPEREKADHTTNPLDVADRAMLFGVLDDIDSVMSSSEIGDDGLPQDRYSEVLANLQFLGLFRPKYQDGVDEDDDPDAPAGTTGGAAQLDAIDVGLHEDLDEFDLPDTLDAERDGIVEIL